LNRPPFNYRPTWAEISTASFSFNVSQIRKWIGKHTQLLAVLKANAYGHAASALAPVALKAGATSIGVSSLEEGISLRDAGIAAPILILGGLYPLKNFSVARDCNLTPTVASPDGYKAFLSAAKRTRRPWSFHLKVDTGMGRIGASPEQARRILSNVADKDRRFVAGIYSHLATADSDQKFAEEQLSLLNGVRDHAERLGFDRSLFHVANTAAIFSSRRFHMQMVRPGIGLYGVSAV
jgi:alanine racemase